MTDHEAYKASRKEALWRARKLTDDEAWSEWKRVAQKLQFAVHCMMTRGELSPWNLSLLRGHVQDIESNMARLEYHFGLVDRDGDPIEKEAAP